MPANMHLREPARPALSRSGGLIPELREFRRRGRPGELIKSLFVRGRQSIGLLCA